MMIFWITFKLIHGVLGIPSEYAGSVGADRAAGVKFEGQSWFWRREWCRAAHEEHDQQWFDFA